MIIETFTITSQEIAKKDLANQNIDELFLLQTKTEVNKKFRSPKSNMYPIFRYGLTVLGNPHQIASLTLLIKK